MLNFLLVVTLFVSLGRYLCINKNDEAMPKELKNQVENYAEIEALILDLDLEFEFALDGE